MDNDFYDTFYGGLPFEQCWSPNLIYRQGIADFNCGRQFHCPVDDRRARVAYERGWDKAKRECQLPD